MQLAPKSVTVMLTVHEQTGLPGKATIREPLRFAASPQRGRGLAEETAYVTGGGPNGSNATRSFWMCNTVAASFKAACHAALTDGNLYVITFA